MRDPLTYLLSMIWRHAAADRRSIVAYWVMFVIANIISIVFYPLALAWIIDIIQKKGVTTHTIGILCAILSATLGLDMLFWAFHGPARVIENCIGFKARSNYRRHLLTGVLGLPLNWHSDHHSGDTIDKIAQGTTGLYAFASSTFLTIGLAVQLIICYGMLAYFSWPAAIIVLAMIALTVWITMRFDRTLIREYGELNLAENQISQSVQDAINNITTVIILRVERLVFEAISHKLDKPFGLYRKNAVQVEVKWFLTNMCCAFMTVAVMAVYFYQHLGSSKGILIGEVYLLLRYLDNISQLFFRFCSIYGDILQRKSRVMNAELLSADFRSESFNDHVLPADWKRIAIRGLDFSYQAETNADQHLQDISLDIHRGERIAFVGASGSGKTTMLKVIRGLYAPQKIAVEADGKAISQGFDGIARDITLVPQDPQIFATTIRENITLGAEYSEDAIRRALDMACFAEVAESLPHKLDSSIKEKGVNLSGGQQQRLALARGLLASEDKSIVLLDEPTSSVDIANEMRIYRKIFSGFPDKAIVSSIHRLHLLSLFDRVYMFEKGRIVGSGTLDELLVSCAAFQELWNKYQRHEESFAQKSNV